MKPKSTQDRPQLVPHNMPKPSAAHLAGLEYAYRLWLEVEQNNEESSDEDGADWLNFSEQIELAIRQARSDSRGPQQ